MECRKGLLTCRIEQLLPLRADFRFGWSQEAEKHFCPEAMLGRNQLFTFVGGLQFLPRQYSGRESSFFYRPKSLASGARRRVSDRSQVYTSLDDSFQGILVHARKTDSLAVRSWRTASEPERNLASLEAGRGEGEL